MPMDLIGSRPRVYTLPDCYKCEILKGWLKEKGIEFEERAFDTDAQLEFIMRNMFGNPPILELEDRAASSEELFPIGALDELRAMEVLRLDKA